MSKSALNVSQHVISWKKSSLVQVKLSSRICTKDDRSEKPDIYLKEWLPQISCALFEFASCLIFAAINLKIGICLPHRPLKMSFDFKITTLTFKVTDVSKVKFGSEMFDLKSGTGTCLGSGNAYQFWDNHLEFGDHRVKNSQKSLLAPETSKMTLEFAMKTCNFPH